MTSKFQNKYRIPSARLQNWDYTWNAPYFVTVCTKNRECFFGDIVETPNGVEMELSEMGKIAHHFWYEIPIHFPFLKLREFVVMPNHVHGIIIIDNDGNDISGNANVETPKLGVSTKWKPNSLGVIINQYKRIWAFHARQIHAGFEWQSRFHDHIIRTDVSFKRISEYIVNNPAK